MFRKVAAEANGWYSGHDKEEEEEEEEKEMVVVKKGNCGRWGRGMENKERLDTLGSGGDQVAAGDGKRYSVEMQRFVSYVPFSPSCFGI